jgi:uncharacterized protein with GYD domain
MYAVLGEHDLVLTLEFPDAEKALTKPCLRIRLISIY